MTHDLLHAIRAVTRLRHSVVAAVSRRSRSFETNRELKVQSLRHTLKQLQADPTSAGFDPRDRRMTHAGSLGHLAL